MERIAALPPPLQEPTAFTFPMRGQKSERLSKPPGGQSLALIRDVVRPQHRDGSAAEGTGCRIPRGEREHNRMR
jgi:hypothetical protein